MNWLRVFKEWQRPAPRVNRPGFPGGIDLGNLPKVVQESGILFEMTKGSAWQQK